MTSWFELITEKMKVNNDAWDCLVASTLEDDQLFQKFRRDCGGPHGISFVLWTYTHVYFSRNYDGLDYVDSIERNP